MIDGQPYAFDAGGELKQGWDHSHEKSYYFINGISQAGMFREGTLSSDLNGSGSVQPGGNAAPEEDLAEDAEGEPPEEELLEEQPAQTETEDGQTTPATEQQTQPAEDPAAAQDFLCLSAMACAWLLTGCQQPTVEERAVSWQPQQGSSGPASESGPMLNAALDDEAILREGIRIPQNFELPLEGSTGFAGAAVMQLYEKPDENSAVRRRLAAGSILAGLPAGWHCGLAGK